MLKAGFLGPQGTFSQEALEVYFNGREFIAVPYANIPEMLYAVCEDKIAEAVVPIENSLEGAINVTLDMIAWDVDLKIKAEVAISVRQNLLVKRGTGLEDVRMILSHPQPLGQCRKYINSRLPGVETVYTRSTADAAEKVASGNGGMAAIGSATAARVYGLELLDSDIQDESSNHTRFVVLGKSDSEATGRDKSSIVFSTEDKPGSLYRVLDIFNLWDINLTRIESRPAKNQLGKYIFFVDINGHRSDDDVADALTMVRKKTSFFKFLGSYPAQA